MFERRRPHTESLSTTLLRTAAIALVVGTLLSSAGLEAGDRQLPFWKLWLSWVSGVFWFSFGGHWVELFYLNVIRMKLPPDYGIELSARVGIWFAGGCVLFGGMRMTTLQFGNQVLEWFVWWHGGLLFIVVELIVHAISVAVGRVSIYNGQG
jgi:hypothetical protein